ncbi:MAG: hypothetical protein P4L86_02245, partial [Mycobacterium sp.]|nr:hypothetical protein [Mycobacterium sp.]
ATGTATLVGQAGVSVSSPIGATLQAGTGQLLVQGSATGPAAVAITADNASGTVAIRGQAGVSATATTGSLSLEASAGPMSLAALGGSMTLAGSTSLSASTLAGPVSLATYSGSVAITATKVNAGEGQLTLTAGDTAHLNAASDLGLLSTSGDVSVQASTGNLKLSASSTTTNGRVEVDANGADASGVSALLLQSTSGSATLSANTGVNVQATNGKFVLQATGTGGVATGQIIADDKLSLVSNKMAAGAINLNAVGVGGTVVITGNAGVTVVGVTSITGDTTISGKTTANGDAHITGATTLTGDVTIDSTASTTTINGKMVGSFTGGVNVNGKLTIDETKGDAWTAGQVSVGGTNAASAKLTIDPSTGTVTTTGSALLNTASGLALNVNTGKLTVSAAGVTYIDGTLTTNDKLTVQQNGARIVGLAVLDNTNTISLTATGLIQGSAGIKATGGDLTVVTGNAELTAGSLYVGAAASRQISLNADGSILTTGPATIGGLITASGGIDATGQNIQAATLVTTGSVTVGGGASVTGATTIAGATTVTGTVTLQNSATPTSSVVVGPTATTVTGPTNIVGVTHITGATTLTGDVTIDSTASTTTINGKMVGQFNGGVSINNKLTVSELSGNVWTGGDLTAGGTKAADATFAVTGLTGAVSINGPLSGTFGGVGSGIKVGANLFTVSAATGAVTTSDQLTVAKALSVGGDTTLAKLSTSSSIFMNDLTAGAEIYSAGAIYASTSITAMNGLKVNAGLLQASGGVAVTGGLTTDALQTTALINAVGGLTAGSTLTASTGMVVSGIGIAVTAGDILIGTTKIAQDGSATVGNGLTVKGAMLTAQAGITSLTSLTGATLAVTTGPSTFNGAVTMGIPTSMDIVTINGGLAGKFNSDLNVNSGQFVVKSTGDVTNAGTILSTGSMLATTGGLQVGGITSATAKFEVIGATGATRIDGALTGLFAGGVSINGGKVVISEVTGSTTLASNAILTADNVFGVKEFRYLASQVTATSVSPGPLLTTTVAQLDVPSPSGTTYYALLPQANRIGQIQEIVVTSATLNGWNLMATGSDTINTVSTVGIPYPFDTARVSCIAYEVSRWSCASTARNGATSPAVGAALAATTCPGGVGGPAVLMGSTTSVIVSASGQCIQLPAASAGGQVHFVVATSAILAGTNFPWTLTAHSTGEFINTPTHSTLLIDKTTARVTCSALDSTYWTCAVSQIDPTVVATLQPTNFQFKTGTLSANAATAGTANTVSASQSTMIAIGTGSANKAFLPSTVAGARYEILVPFVLTASLTATASSWVLATTDGTLNNGQTSITFGGGVNHVFCVAIDSAHWECNTDDFAQLNAYSLVTTGTCTTLSASMTTLTIQAVGQCVKLPTPQVGAIYTMTVAQGNANSWHLQPQSAGTFINTNLASMPIGALISVVRCTCVAANYWVCAETDGLARVNIMAESRAVLSDLNKLADVVATATELNSLVGIVQTSSVEFNRLYGYAGVQTGTANELNYLVGAKEGAPTKQKAVLTNLNGAVSYLFTDAQPFTTGSTMSPTAQVVSLSVVTPSNILTLPAIPASSTGHRYTIIVPPTNAFSWRIQANGATVNSVPPTGTLSTIDIPVTAQTVTCTIVSSSAWTCVQLDQYGSYSQSAPTGVITTSIATPPVSIEGSTAVIVSAAGSAVQLPTATVGSVQDLYVRMPNAFQWFLTPTTGTINGVAGNLQIAPSTAVVNCIATENDKWICRTQDTDAGAIIAVAGATLQSTTGTAAITSLGAASITSTGAAATVAGATGLTLSSTTGPIALTTDTSAGSTIELTGLAVNLNSPTNAKSGVTVSGAVLQ